MVQGKGGATSRVGDLEVTNALGPLATSTMEADAFATPEGSRCWMTRVCRRWVAVVIQALNGKQREKMNMYLRASSRARLGFSQDLVQLFAASMLRRYLVLEVRDLTQQLLHPLLGALPLSLDLFFQLAVPLLQLPQPSLPRPFSVRDLAPGLVELLFGRLQLRLRRRESTFQLRYFGLRVASFGESARLQACNRRALAERFDLFLQLDCRRLVCVDFALLCRDALPPLSLDVGRGLDRGLELVELPKAPIVLSLERAVVAAGQKDATADLRRCVLVLLLQTLFDILKLDVEARLHVADALEPRDDVVVKHAKVGERLCVRRASLPLQTSRTRKVSSLFRTVLVTRRTPDDTSFSSCWYTVSKRVFRSLSWSRNVCSVFDSFR